MADTDLPATEDEKKMEHSHLEVEDGSPHEGVWIPTNSFPDFLRGTKLLLLDHKILYTMLIFIPIALGVSIANSNAIAIFITCMLAIIPLSKLLGQATEELSLRTGEAIGGLLNATFGNAVELIIAIVALKDGLLRVVQASLLGSILSNLLLVMGMSFVAGGVRFKSQHFNLTSAQTSSSLLLLAVLAILMPAVFFLSLNVPADDAENKVLRLSRFVAIIILLVYGLYLFFQLKTHKHLYEDDATDKKTDVEKKNEVEEEEETPRLSVWGATFLLAVVTVLVAVLSEFLVGSIESVTEPLSISETFIGIIILPIVGNAAEHVTAVSVAMKDKMDLSIGVAIGSSIQISLLVIPLLVVLGWIIGQPLSLYFLLFETCTLFLAVIITNAVLADGESNWLEGVFLLAAYLAIAGGFFLHDDPSKPPPQQ